MVAQSFVVCSHYSLRNVLIENFGKKTCFSTRNTNIVITDIFALDSCIIVVIRDGQ